MRIILTLILALTSALANAEDKFSTPEEALKSYYKCLEKGDAKCVIRHVIDLKEFNISGPQSTIKYTIKKITTYTEKEAAEWNNKGIIPQAKIGDVELQIYEEHENYSGMWSYNLRQVNDSWLFVTWSAWDDL